MKLPVDYNSHVNEGEVLAELDNEIYKSRLIQEQAGSERAKAEVVQAETKLTLAKSELDTATEANKRLPNSLPQSEVRKLQGNYQAAAASLSAARANLTQAESAVEIASRNLEHTVIRSPINGTVLAATSALGKT